MVAIPRIKLDKYFRYASVIQMLKNRIQTDRLPIEVCPVGRRKERPMRKWFVPLTVLGVGSIGAFLLSERGRNSLRALFENFRDVPDHWLEWNDNAQRELDLIQAALNRIAESLEPRPQLEQ